MQVDARSNLIGRAPGVIRPILGFCRLDTVLTGGRAHGSSSAAYPTAETAATGHGLARRHLAFVIRHGLLSSPIGDHRGPGGKRLLESVNLLGREYGYRALAYRAGELATANRPIRFAGMLRFLDRTLLGEAVPLLLGHLDQLVGTLFVELLFLSKRCDSTKPKCPKLDSRQFANPLDVTPLFLLERSPKLIASQPNRLSGGVTERFEKPSGNLLSICRRRNGDPKQAPAVIGIRLFDTFNPL